MVAQAMSNTTVEIASQYTSMNWKDRLGCSNPFFLKPSQRIRINLLRRFPKSYGEYIRTRVNPGRCPGHSSSLLITDNGNYYSSKEFNQSSQEWSFIHQTSNPQHPRSNELAQKAVQT
ncbi:K02A2.6-like [Cordylochernes scorpioides]|uniref:K02A2.6-like n=1 Tax=Cordylochernes scorpioides TaxID=51811 RepID=A0ABY6LAC4_9ARAC|nr:K02A2.6-like [Cordylochernes scorpioides]